MALKFVVEKSVEDGRGRIHADPAFVRIAKGQRKPLPADGRHTAGFGRVWRHERRLRHQPLPGLADIDEVIAVGAIAMQEYNELARRPRTRRQPRTIKLCGHLSSV